MPARRVAITGIGIVSPLGGSAAASFGKACAGRSGIVRLRAAFASRLASPIAAPCADFDGAAHFDPPRLRMLDRVSQLAIVAAREALHEARLPEDAVDPERAGVFVGVGMGGAQTSDDGYRTLYGERSDRIKPYTVLAGMSNAPAGWISSEQGWRGPSLSYSTACSSSSVAIGEAWMRLRAGLLDVAVAGGSEAPLCLGSMKAWEALHTIASIDPDDPSASCKPFAGNRSGMVLGEGAAFVVLEDWERAAARGVGMLGEMAGYGLVTDVAHITRPSTEGQAAAMRAALRAAQCEPAAVDAINAHGTGTAANDAVETAAIKEVFGDRAGRIPVSATKSMHGHLLGAAGALEFALSVLAMRASVLLPTLHLRVPDPACDLDYVPDAARHGQHVRTVLSSSFAFGGTNAVLVARRAD